MGRLIDADKYMAHLRANINTTSDVIDEHIKQDEPIGTVKDGGQIGYLMALQWARNSLELDCFTVEAIPKDQYEARLKADLVAILTEIQLEIEELSTPPAYQDEDYFLIGTNRCSELIQQKINSLKSESEEYINFADDLIPIMNETESEG